MMHALDIIFWATGATLWFLGGLGTTLVAGLFLVEFVAKRIGWYDLLWAGVVEAAQKRQMLNRFRQKQNLK